MDFFKNLTNFIVVVSMEFLFLLCHKFEFVCKLVNKQIK